MRELLVLGWRNLAIGLGGAIAYRYDAAVIGAVLPVKDVAPYALSLSTANFTRTISTAGTNLLIPSYAHSDALDDRERQFRLFSWAVLVSMGITGPAVICFAAFGPDLLQIWLGSVPDQTWQVMVALNLMMLLQLPGHQAGILLAGIARTKLLAAHRDPGGSGQPRPQHRLHVVVGPDRPGAGIDAAGPAPRVRGPAHRLLSAPERRRTPGI